MATQLLEIPVVDTVDYRENGEDQIRLPRTNHIRRINMDFTVDVTTAIAGGANRKNFSFLNLIKRIKLEAGTTTIFSWSGVQKFLMDWHELGVVPWAASRTSDAVGKYYVRFSHDFAIERRALRSLGQVLNPAQFADLKFSVEWGDRSDWRGGANAGVIDEDNTQCNVSLVTAYNDSQEGDNLIPDKPPLIREVGRNRLDITRKYSDLDGDSLEADIIPTGNTVLRRFLLAEKDIAAGTAPVYADDVIESVQYQDIRGGRELYVRDNWNRLVGQNIVDFGLRSRQTGFLIEDWSDFRAGGLFVPSSEALKAYYTTSAPTNADANKNALTVIERFI